MLPFTVTSRFATSPSVISPIVQRMTGVFLFCLRIAALPVSGSRPPLTKSAQPLPPPCAVTPVISPIVQRMNGVFLFCLRIAALPVSGSRPPLTRSAQPLPPPCAVTPVRSPHAVTVSRNVHGPSGVELLLSGVGVPSPLAKVAAIVAPGVHDGPSFITRSVHGLFDSLKPAAPV